MLNLADIEARAAAATEGPWEWDAPSDETWPSGDQNLGTQARDENGCRKEWVVNSWGYDADGISASDEDRAFIASSRTDVPLLVAAVRERDILIAAAERIVGEQEARIRELEAENAKIDDLDEALRQRDREILGLRRELAKVAENSTRPDVTGFYRAPNPMPYGFAELAARSKVVWPGVTTGKVVSE